MTTAEPIRFIPPEAPEDRARADLYALIARLFYAPPDTDLLQALAEADEIVGEDDSVALAEAWAGLQRACAAIDEDAAQEEYDSLLIGVGKAVVPPYVGAYVEGNSGNADSPEALLVGLRAYLAERGLGRQASVSEPEDHVAALAELMRHLISVQQADIDEQRECFHRFLYPGAVRLCDALEAAESANFYKPVARFARAFFELERSAFEML
jgi:TorA maturation chaperone TorD